MVKLNWVSHWNASPLKIISQKMPHKQKKDTFMKKELQIQGPTNWKIRTPKLNQWRKTVEWCSSFHCDDHHHHNLKSMWTWRSNNSFTRLPTENTLNTRGRLQLPDPLGRCVKLTELVFQLPPPPGISTLRDIKLSESDLIFCSFCVAQPDCFSPRDQDLDLL